MTHEHLSHDEIIDYLHHELAPGDDARMLAHLETCAACGAAYEAEARLSDALRGYARASERDLPQGVVHRIWDAVEREATAPSLGERIAAWLRPAILAPAALALVAVIAIGFALRSHGSGPTIEAAYYLNDHAALTGTVPFGEGSVLPTTLEQSAASDLQTVATTSGRTVSIYAYR